MKKLYIVRHAKSGWKYDIKDIDRPLNERGYHDAYKVAGHLAGRKEIPQRIITSPAVRAITTALNFARTFSLSSSNFIINEKIYEAATESLLSIIKSIEEDKDSVMLFGHEPSLSSLIGLLTGSNVSFTTCNVALLTFNSSWSEITPGTGKQAFLLRPREL